MLRLVEIACMNKYEGLHTFNTAKQIIWARRGFFGLDRNKDPRDRMTEKEFMALQDIEEINSHLLHGKIYDPSIEENNIMKEK